ncbi:nuclear transport factor 2 family protein [Novosphingobium terrae]|uniref:nuclear transport factor 2 family protein n=1 Tax=Novosphingobium terrae TaxID=2726189 RepID=UPI00197D64F8|nr:nuclear transport factor 2 family protein [Novosphingobium terrae]
MPQAAAERIDDAMDRLAIAELLQNWVLWRDAGDWERFATVWHDDGRMAATWFRASAAEFIAGCRKGFDAGMVGLHALGGISVDVRGSRAIAQSKMQIVQRGMLDEVEVDVTCLGRFADALDKRDGQWGMVFRQPIYELDRITPVNPAQVPQLDEALLASFPQGYRHLAYLQTRLGFTVHKDLPGTRGPAVDALMESMRQWLDGADASCFDA